MSRSKPLYHRRRFPAEIISHCVWLYFRFCLSYRDVEELMAERGITLTYEAVRYWCRTFGQAYANQLRRLRPRPGDKWHLDEVFLTIKGEHYCSRFAQIFSGCKNCGKVLSSLRIAVHDEAMADPRIDPPCGVICGVPVAESESYDRAPHP